MIELLYGTGNPAKITLMKEFLRGMPISLLGLRDIDRDWPEPDETGRYPLENARQKAEVYYRACGKPVFSCDSGLFIDELSEEEQPGVHVRNICGRRLTDAEMTAHYAGIARRFGGRCKAQYRNAICLILDGGRCFELEGQEISGDKFYLTDRIKEQKEEGFPLDCISIDIKTGRYFSEEEDLLFCNDEKEGFRRFFARALQIPVDR